MEVYVANLRFMLQIANNYACCSLATGCLCAWCCSGCRLYTSSPRMVKLVALWPKMATSTRTHRATQAQARRQQPAACLQSCTSAASTMRIFHLELGTGANSLVNNSGKHWLKWNMATLETKSFSRMRQKEKLNLLIYPLPDQNI